MIKSAFKDGIATQTGTSPKGADAQLNGVDGLPKGDARKVPVVTGFKTSKTPQVPRVIVTR